MKYRFSKALDNDYSPLANYLLEGTELSKEELLAKCAGEINYDLLQMIKELEFEKIGKTREGELYLK